MPYARKRPPLDPCPVETVLALVAGKWKARILRVLFDGPRSFGALRKALGAVTQQVLAAQLRALEEDGLVARRPVTANGVAGSRYDLTPEARSLLPALDGLAVWGAARLRRQGLGWAPGQGPLAQGSGQPTGQGMNGGDGAGAGRGE